MQRGDSQQPTTMNTNVKLGLESSAEMLAAVEHFVL